MIQQLRHERMIDYLNAHEILSVEEAMALFAASPATIRRDFNDLAAQGLVQRVRGGIKLVRAGGQPMLPFSLREVRHSREKEALARRAAGLLRPGDVIFIDGGTTTFHLGGCLPDIPLCLITNSLRLAAALEERRAERARWDICVTGGFIYPHSGGLLLGPTAQASLAQYHAHWAFLSAGGVAEGGITNTNELVVDTERIMIGHAEKTVILADHSKIGKYALCHVCPLDRVDFLITDEWPESTELLSKFGAAGVEVLLLD